MRKRSRSFMMSLLGAAVAAIMSAVGPAAAAASVPGLTVVQCILEPGVYAVMDSGGQTVAILIVYPDCRMELFRKVEEPE